VHRENKAFNLQTSSCLDPVAFTNIPDHLDERFSEGRVEGAVDDHVGRGVEHQEQVTETITRDLDNYK
jgi:hypothetical protein